MQCEIMRLMVDEWLTQREIAKRLFRDHRTIGKHCEYIRDKMGARNQHHAIVMWDRHMRANAVLLANLALREAA